MDGLTLRASASSYKKMGEAKEKANRRAIRRAFGEEAAESVSQQREDMGKLLVLIAELGARVNLLEAHGATWKSRLRWLIRGDN